MRQTNVQHPQLTLSNLPTDAIMLQSDDTLQQLIQSLWPESTCTLLPSTDRNQIESYCEWPRLERHHWIQISGESNSRMCSNLLYADALHAACKPETKIFNSCVWCARGVLQNSPTMRLTLFKLFSGMDNQSQENFKPTRWFLSPIGFEGSLQVRHEIQTTQRPLGNGPQMLHTWATQSRQYVMLQWLFNAHPACKQLLFSLTFPQKSMLALHFHKIHTWLIMFTITTTGREPALCISH